MELASFHISMTETELNQTVLQLQPEFPALHNLDIHFLDGHIMLTGKIKKFIAIPFHVKVSLLFMGSSLIFQFGEDSTAGKLTRSASRVLLNKITARLNPRIFRHSGSRVYVEVNELLKELHIKSSCTIRRFEIQTKTLHLELDGQVEINFQTLLTQQKSRSA